MNIGEQEALANVRLEGLKKTINADSWDMSTEYLMKSWGEKAGGLRWLHFQAAKKWKQISDRLTLPVILLSTITGVANFGATNTSNPEIWMYTLGSLNILTALFASVKQFYNPDMKCQLHRDVGKQFGSFFRQMSLELGVSRAERRPCPEILSWARLEFDRLQLDAPPINGEIISQFNKIFSQIPNKPDIVSDNFHVEIYSETQVECNISI
jgi:hypothetical protein